MKIVLFFIVIFSSVKAYNQTVLIDEDFESYTTGEKLAGQSDHWETWSGPDGSIQDALVKEGIGLSGSNALHINVGNDMVLEFGDHTEGNFSIEFNMYILEDGYFNFMHSCRSITAFDMFLTSSNDIDFLTDINDETIHSYAQNTWINFSFDINLHMDQIIIYIDGEERGIYPFSASGWGGEELNILSCINFFGLHDFNGVGHANYYLDDVKVIDLGFAEIETQEIDFKIFPNPTADFLNIEFNGIIEKIEVYSLSGQLILESKDNKLDVRDVNEGMYIVKIITEEGAFTERIKIVN